MIPGLGKESGGWGREDISVGIKIQIIYNPTNVSLPIKLHKHKPSNPSNPENIHLQSLKFIHLTL
jgi:hypothetical protein